MNFFSLKDNVKLRQLGLSWARLEAFRAFLTQKCDFLGHFFNQIWLEKGKGVNPQISLTEKKIISHKVHVMMILKDQILCLKLYFVES